MSEVRTRYATRAGFDPPDPIDDAEPADWRTPRSDREAADMRRRSVARDQPLRCVALRRDGQPCQAFVSTPDGRCIMHSPRATEVHARGGVATSSANRAAKLLPSRLQPIVSTLEHAFYQVHAGELDVRRAVAMATLASAIGRLIALGDYEERVRALEENAARIAGETGGQ